MDNDDGVVDQISELRKRIEAKMSLKELADANGLLSKTQKSRGDFVNTMGAYVFAMTGKSLAGSDDPLDDPGIGPAMVEIDENGSISLFNRTADLPTLLQDLKTFFTSAPRPEVRVFIVGKATTPASSKAYYATIVGINNLKIDSLNLVTQMR